MENDCSASVENDMEEELIFKVLMWVSEVRNRKYVHRRPV
jgi:hypothetical protein